MTTEDNNKPNWLLRVFILVSLSVHGVLLAQIAELYRSRDLTYIELEIRDARPQARDIPVPPRRHRAPPPQVLPPPIPQPAPVMPTIPEPAPIREPSPEILTAPDAPPEEAVDWPMPGADAGPYDSAADYAGMVRMKIESHKQYPAAARNRQFQGRVRVGFVINTDGSLRDAALIESSRHEILNQAALAAIRDAAPFPRPPRNLFSGPVSMEIIIVFELM